jgi:hypothetical protein
MASSSTSKRWSETRNGRIVVAAGMVGLFVLVFWLAMKSRRMLAEPAALVVEDQYLWFGEVCEDPAFVWALPIRNTTNQEIEIDSFTASCSCAKIEPSKLTIPAAKTADVRLTLNLLSAQTIPNLAGQEFKVAVQPQIAKGARAQTGWVLQGKVKKPFAVDPPVVDFEESLARWQPFAPRTATITCGLDVAELTASCDSPSLSASVTRDAKDSRRFCLEIQPHKDIGGGAFSYLVRLTALTPGKKEISGTVSVVGRVIEEISLQPELLAFGAEPVGARLHETVFVQSRNGKEFDVQKIETGGNGDISVELRPKSKDGRQSFVVSFPVKQLQHQEHTIHVKVKTPEGLLDLPLRMNCYGLPAQAIGMK